MAQTAFAVLAGFAIWFGSVVLFSFIAVYFWGHSSDSYASVAVTAWLGSTLAFVIAGLTKEKIAPDLSDRTFVLVLGAIVLLWASSSMIDGIDLDFKALALAGHLLAIVIAFRQTRPWSRPSIARDA